MKNIDNLLRLIQKNREKFSDEFVEWLPKNEHIWDAFVRETFTIIGVGFKHYSARTIIHVLRHHSAIKENGKGWKISNNSSPYLGRLFALNFPSHADIFQFKSTPRAEDDNWLRKNQHKFNDF